LLGGLYDDCGCVEKVDEVWCVEKVEEIRSHRVAATQDECIISNDTTTNALPSAFDGG
jgi:hypothetical protein